MVIREIRKLLLNTLSASDVLELMKFVLKADAAYIFANGEKELSAAEEEQLFRLAGAVKDGEPIQYILGEWDFMGYTFKVNENVLIPRSDTELLAELTVKNARGGDSILELCTGSGCIAVAVANLVKDSFVTAAELYDGALSLAKENIKRLTAGNVRAVKLDVLKAPPKSFRKKFDIITSNPPYIKSADIPYLDKNVRREPKSALDGGEDGLVFYRAIADKWKRTLKPGGKMLFEIGFDEAEDVRDILAANGFENITVHKDTGGNDRVIIGTLPA